MANTSQASESSPSISIKYNCKGVIYTQTFQESDTILELSNHVQATCGINPEHQTFVLFGGVIVRYPFNHNLPIMLQKYVGKQIRVLGLTNAELQDLRDIERRSLDQEVDPARENPFDWNAYRQRVGTSPNESVPYGFDDPFDGQSEPSVLTRSWRHDYEVGGTTTLVPETFGIDNVTNPYENLTIRRGIEEHFSTRHVPIFFCEHNENGLYNFGETLHCDCVNEFIIDWFLFARQALSKMSDALNIELQIQLEQQESSVRTAEQLISPSVLQLRTEIEVLEFKALLLDEEYERGIGNNPTDSLWTELTAMVLTLGINYSMLEELPDLIQVKIESIMLAKDILATEESLGIPPRCPLPPRYWV